MICFQAFLSVWSLSRLVVEMDGPKLNGPWKKDAQAKVGVLRERNRGLKLASSSVSAFFVTEPSTFSASGRSLSSTPWEMSTHQVNDENSTHTIVGISFTKFISQNEKYIVWIWCIFLHFQPFSRFLFFILSHFGFNSVPPIQLYFK